jgi:beta-N-acetylhexosaminidase
MNGRWRILLPAWALALAICLLSLGAPASGEDADIEKILGGMTLKEKVGQMFLAVCPADGVKAVQSHHPGGYVLFASNFEGRTPSGIQKTIDGYQRASSIPMLIAVDEEGGTVTRVSRFKAFRSGKFPSPQAVYKDGGWDAIEKDAREKAALLLPLGINVNLAPVADVASGKGDFIYSRSFGTDPALAARFVATVVRESADARLGAVLKHFPGYGGNRDTHTGVAVDDRPLSAFEERDFLPFRSGIEAGAGAVMVSHNTVKCFDEDRPASLSPAVNEALRGLGFDGVAMTDDLSMQAITKVYGQGEAAVLAVEAGNDMLIATAFKTGMAAVLDAVEEGRISEARIDESVRRILKWKRALGLL